MSVFGAVFMKYYIALRSPDLPLPTGSAWVDYLAIRAVAGVCAGAALYAAGRLPVSWLRGFLYCSSLLLVMGGDPDDYARWSLGEWLEIWVVGSLILAVIFGTVFHALERRQRARQAAAGSPDDAL